MRTLVTYMSLSGNTRKLADMIYANVDGPKDLRELGEVQSLEGYDLVFVGFPVHQFGAPASVKEFMEKNAKERNIALFVTHAMPPRMDMLKGIMAKCQAPFAQARVLGVYDCQGELAESVARSLIGSPSPQLQEFGRMRTLTIGHPDAAEISGAGEFARSIVAMVSSG
jgi:hypothetical protein